MKLPKTKSKTIFVLSATGSAVGRQMFGVFLISFTRAGYFS